MSTTLQYVPITEEDWQEVYILTSILSGVPISIQNVGDTDLRFSISATKPARDHDAYKIFKRSQIINHKYGDEKVWLFSPQVDGLINVEINTVSYFPSDIAKGKIPGHETGTIFGRNQDIDPAAPEMIWDFGGLEVYLAADTELFLSSSSVGDVDVGVFVWGMTDDYVFKQEVHTLASGQTQQSIGNFFRIFRLVIVSGSAPLGDIYCAETDVLTGGVPDTDAKVHAKMAVGTGITHKMSGTVPSGYEMHVDRMFMGVRRAEDVVFQFRQQAFGSPMFVEASSFPLYQKSEFLTFKPAFVIDEKTDFDFLGVTVTNNTEAVLNLAYTLINKDFK